MPRLKPEELKSRLRLDFRVCQHMFGNIFSGEAYRTTADLESRRNPIAPSDDGSLAKKYRIDFHVKTLIGPGSFSNLITIGFDLDVSNYPFSVPITWIISNQVPYSPHFRLGAPVCEGDIWSKAQGHLLLGQYMVHIARLLNWDEVATSGGYVGWNGDAIQYHRRVYQGKPLDETIKYPMLPPDLYGLNESTRSSAAGAYFRPARSTPQRVDSSLFKGKGRN